MKLRRSTNSVGRRFAGTKHFQETSLPPNIQLRLEDLPTYVSWNQGAMVNRDSAHAIGGMLELGISDPGWRVAIKARYRRWYTEERSLDLTAGGLVVQERALNRSIEQGYGMTAGAALGTGVAIIVSALSHGDF